MRTLFALLVTVLAAAPASAVDLEGCVYAPDGSLIPNAKITVRVLEQPPIATVTAKDGCFRFTDVPDSVLELRVDAEGHGTKSVLTVAGDPPVTIAFGDVPPDSSIVERDGPRRVEGRRSTGTGVIHGVVRVGAKPLAGAPVLIQPYEEGAATIRLVTDAKGRYRATALAAVRHAVAIGDGLHPLYRSMPGSRMYAEGHEPHVADLAKTPEAELDVELTRAPLVRGRVVDAEGKPVRGALVRILLAGRSAGDFAYEPSVRTTADGRYALAAPPFSATDQAVVAVKLPRHSIVRSKPFFIREADIAADVTLPKFESVTLRASDREGKPLRDAQVAFAESEEIGGMQDASFLLSPRFVSSALRTDEAGEVALRLTPGSYEFAGVAKGYQLTLLSGHAIARPTTVQLRLEQAFAIRGRVHRNGTGVANVQLMLLGGEGGRRREQMARTEGDGTFEIGGLARGSYRLSVMKHDELLDRVVEAEAPSTIEVALPPAGTLRGRVLDAATRQPVPGFAYSITPLDAERPASGRHAQMLQRGGEMPDGSFSALIPAGTYSVTASASGYTVPPAVEVRVTDREPASVEILLERGMSISGRVVDESGTPVETADVFAISPEAERNRTRSSMRVGPMNVRTGADGLFTITGLEAGEVQVTVRKEGYVLFRKVVDAQPGLAPLDVRLTRGLSIEGIVTRAGKPVGGVQVSATTAAIGGEHQPAISEDDGRFVLRGLIAARYTVSAYKDDLHTEVRDVDPANRKELVLTLDARPKGVIYGTVSGMPANLGGKIVRRAVFVSGDENGAEGMIDDAGSYRIEDAPAGPVWVSAHVESSTGGRSSSRKRVEVVPGQPVRVDLELTGAVRVTGRVTHDGKPLPGARVVFSSDEGMASATTGSSGVYELALATPGRYQIFAHAERMTEQHYATMRDIRGSETIDIDLREQVVEGSVVDAGTRQPIAGAIVTLAPNMTAVMSVGGETATDADGRFRIVTAASGPHRLIAAAPGYAHRAIPATLGGSQVPPTTFELSPIGELRVRVLDARTGAPLEAHLVLTEADGTFLPLRAERTSDGTTYLFSVAPGRYGLTAIVHGYAAKAVEVTAPGGVDIQLE